ncbi:hypothetical protein WMY93_001704 [Mugilogobius chulae]|uniref:G-protein coupled receptors family 1 profile domain-containing protein n=1 Tax=Mugilogobius chulae TaxID=88201 RepID=A0AAW0PRP5_9GOBI
MKLRQGRKKSNINTFILNLARVLPHGHGVTRYLSVSSALKKRAFRRARCVHWVCACCGVCATLATAPTAVFSAVTVVAGEKLCLLRFPEGHDWLALYHIQKILVAFVVPMLIVCASYVLLLRYVRQRSMNAANSRRRSRVTRSVAIVVLSFFCCWMPNHAITLWGVLVKLNAVHWDKSYYLVHTYVFPVTVCLAHTNSCLNPVLYCLMRPEIRKMLSGTFWKVSTLSSNKPCATRSFTHGDTHGHAPVQLLDSDCGPARAHTQHSPFIISAGH